MCEMKSDSLVSIAIEEVITFSVARIDARIIGRCDKSSASFTAIEYKSAWEFQKLLSRLQRVIFVKKRDEIR